MTVTQNPWLLISGGSSCRLVGNDFPFVSKFLSILQVKLKTTRNKNVAVTSLKPLKGCALKKTAYFLKSVYL